MRPGHFCHICGESKYHRHCHVCEEPIFEGAYKTGLNTCQRCKNEKRAQRERSQKTGFIVVTDPGDVPLQPGLVLWKEEVRQMRIHGSFYPGTIIADKKGSKFKITSKMEMVKLC